MAEFPNNQFTNDTNDEHMLRINMCVVGMTAHPEAAFRGTLVADMTTHRDTFELLENQHAAEWGDEQAATAYTNLCEDALSAKLSSARFMVESMIEEEDIAPVVSWELRRDFGIEASKPRSRDSMLALGKKMVETNARYVAEASPYALPEPFFADLSTKTDTLETAISTHDTELKERLSVGLAKELQRTKGNRLLAQAFKWLCAVFGPDDFILLDFGFVPTSQIVTPGQPEIPIPDWPGPGAFTGRYLGQKQVELIYGPVKDATHCDIEWKEKNAPNEDYVVLFNDITMDPKEITRMRELNVPKGKRDYRLVPFNGMEKGDIAEITVDVKD